jgi:hypothetical protein
LSHRRQDTLTGVLHNCHAVHECVTYLSRSRQATVTSVLQICHAVGRIHSQVCYTIYIL